jgi:hypothetical protein
MLSGGENDQLLYQPRKMSSSERSESSDSETSSATYEASRAHKSSILPRSVASTHNYASDPTKQGWRLQPSLWTGKSPLFGSRSGNKLLPWNPRLMRVRKVSFSPWRIRTTFRRVYRINRRSRVDVHPTFPVLGLQTVVSTIASGWKQNKSAIARKFTPPRCFVLRSHANHVVWFSKWNIWRIHIPIFIRF